MAVWTKDSIQLGVTLPQVSRRWSLKLFADRHQMVYGVGNVMVEEWPERNIHSDDKAAHREGLVEAVGAAPQAIAQLHRSLMMAFGTGWIAGGRINVKMIKPLLQDDFTTAKGRVVGLGFEADVSGLERLRATCDIWVERRDGTRIMVGTASAFLED